MRLKYRIPLAIIAICMVITMFIASSYALWSVTITQESKNAIESGCFAITFDDTNSSSINLTNTYPIPDDKGLKTTPYTFTIKNTCTVDARFTLYLNTLNVPKKTVVVDGKESEIDNKIADDFIKYSLIESDGAVAVAQSLINAEKNPDTSYFTFKEDFGKDVLKSYALTTGTLKGQSAEGVDDGESITYSLRLWIDEVATTEINGQTFEAGISTVAYATKLGTDVTPEPTDPTEPTSTTD